MISTINKTFMNFKIDVRIYIYITIMNMREYQS
jgi:hypothetical protein